MNTIKPVLQGMDAKEMDRLLALAKAIERSPFPGRPLPPFPAKEVG